jgi:hypothetical protein
VNPVMRGAKPKPKPEVVEAEAAYLETGIVGDNSRIRTPKVVHGKKRIDLQPQSQQRRSVVHITSPPQLCRRLRTLVASRERPGIR